MMFVYVFGTQYLENPTYLCLQKNIHSLDYEMGSLNQIVCFDKQFGCIFGSTKAVKPVEQKEQWVFHSFHIKGGFSTTYKL